MQKRTLGGNLEVSAVGLGCMGFSHAYGAPTDRSEAIRLIREAVDAGYTFFDTAETYGTREQPHHNEELLGQALAPFRGEVVIATKFGIRFDTESGTVPYPLIADSSPKTIRASVEGSLRRLQVERIDLYYQHRPDPKTPIEEVAETMASLVREGKIARWGLSQASEEQIRRAHAIFPITAVQNRYSMMARQYEALFPTFEELNIGFVAFSPMANGFLTGAYDSAARFDDKDDYRRSMPQFSSERMEANQELLALLRRTAADKEATPAQISMAWMLGKKPWIVPIPGTRRIERMRENAASVTVGLSEAEVAALDAALDACPMSNVFGTSGQ